MTDDPVIEQHITHTSDLLSREEAARYLGVAIDTLAVWASTKRYPLPYVKVGRLARYRKQDLDAFIDARTVNCERSAS